jgi:hypothetical protein
MTQRLAERFARGEGAPVELDGRLVHMMHALAPVTAPAALRIRLCPSGVRPQALNVSARDGTVLVNGEELTHVVLWTDTAPPEVVAELRPAGGRPMTVHVWNGWRDHEDVAQAWIGDAGMVVEDHGDGRVTLRCSDGYDRPSFDDLVVELALDPSG